MPLPSRQQYHHRLRHHHPSRLLLRVQPRLIPLRYRHLRRDRQGCHQCRRHLRNHHTLRHRFRNSRRCSASALSFTLCTPRSALSTEANRQSTATRLQMFSAPMESISGCLCRCPPAALSAMSSCTTLISTKRCSHPSRFGWALRLATSHHPMHTNVQGQ